MAQKTRKKKAAHRRLARVHDDGVTMADTDVVTVCEKSHRRVPLTIADVPHSQKGSFRHRCAGCAYEQGYRDGYNAALAAIKKAAPMVSDAQVYDDYDDEELDPDAPFRH